MDWLARALHNLRCLHLLIRFKLIDRRSKLDWQLSHEGFVILNWRWTVLYFNYRQYSIETDGVLRVVFVILLHDRVYLVRSIVVQKVFLALRMVLRVVTKWVAKLGLRVSLLLVDEGSGRFRVRLLSDVHFFNFLIWKVDGLRSSVVRCFTGKPRRLARQMQVKHLLVWSCHEGLNWVPRSKIDIFIFFILVVVVSWSVTLYR